MKIVIAGAGDVGTHLARLLSYEKKEITIIDLSAERLQKIANQIERGGSERKRYLLSGT